VLWCGVCGLTLSLLLCTVLAGVGVNSKTYTLCAGSLGYLAPEQLQHVGHGTAVDHWAVGVLLCELLTGTHPFSPALCSFGDAGDTIGSRHDGNATVAQEVEDQVNNLFAGGDVEAGMHSVLLGQWSSTLMAVRMAGKDADAADLIGSLLSVDPTDRPCTAGRTAALISHRWFAARLGDSLGAVVERTATAPLVGRGPAARPPKPGSGIFGDFWRAF
jgi:serine/threonine protein kinase